MSDRLRDQGCPLPPRGWWCNLPPGHGGTSCPTRPRWWNFTSVARSYRRAFRRH